MGTAYEDYQQLEYQRSSSGLFIPVGKWKDIAEVLDYGESLGKANTLSPAEEKLRQMYRKMGTLVSTLHQSVYYNMTAYGASDKPPGTISHLTLLLVFLFPEDSARQFA